MLRREKAFRAVKHAAVGMLFVCVCLLNTSTVQGQEKPPILSEKDISAFDKNAIKTLELTAGGINPEAAQLARNKLIAIGVEQVDAAFNEYRTKSRKRHDLLQFLFDFLEIGASSAINIVNGAERTRELIAEGLSLFQGTRAAFNKDFKFLERQLLFDKMVAMRAQKLAAIYGKLSKGVGEYPWEQARSELRGYFYAGTIDEALTSLSVDTGADASVSLKALEEAKKDAGIKGQVTQLEIEANKGIAPLWDKLVNSQDLPTIKAVYARAQQDPLLAPLLKAVPQYKSLTSDGKKGVEGSLAAINGGNAVFLDYSTVLFYLKLTVMDMIVDDSKPAAAFNKILK